MSARLGLFALLVLLLALAAGAFGCDDHQPLPTFRVSFLARSDGDPLAGVQVVAGSHRVGTTGPSGLLRIDIRGREGQALPVQATCPPHFRPPTDLPVLTLRSFRGLDPQIAERGIEVTIDCLPTRRTAAVVVRASGQADLPVRVRGREVARTDRSGAAHFMMNLSPHSTFRVDLDTTGHDTLRPQNPSATFTLADADEILLFDQAFQESKPHHHYHHHPRPPPGPHLPIRLGPAANP